MWQAEKLNINDMVRFRLTAAGREIFAQHFAEQAKALGLPEPYPWFKYHQPDVAGFYSEQLWVLMTIVGPHLHLGMGDALFEANEIHF